MAVVAAVEGVLVVRVAADGIGGASIAAGLATVHNSNTGLGKVKEGFSVFDWGGRTAEGAEDAGGREVAR